MDELSYSELESLHSFPEAQLLNDRGKPIDCWEPIPGVYIPKEGDGDERQRVIAEMDRLFPKEYFPNLSWQTNGWRSWVRKRGGSGSNDPRGA